VRRSEIAIPLPRGDALGGTLVVPEEARGVIAFAHGSGSSRNSPRNNAVAATLNEAGFATLLMDLLTGDEEEAERLTRHLRFDIELLAERLGIAIEHLDETLAVPIGLFGASTGAAAALAAAAREPARVRAVVSRGGRPDLADDALPSVQAPTLLIVGDLDTVVIDLNEKARRRMKALVEMRLIRGATHLFEEPGALGQVAALARAWFEDHLSSGS
jgi:pimeloyl-ACP methyl ester carboxylesterase